MKKYLLVFVLAAMALVLTAANTLVPVTVINKSSQPASVTLADPASDLVEPTVLFYFSVDAAGTLPVTKVFEVPKGKYLVQVNYCGDWSAWYLVSLTGRKTFTIPPCGATTPVQNDGATKLIRSARLVSPE